MLETRNKIAEGNIITDAQNTMHDCLRKAFGNRVSSFEHRASKCLV